MLTSSDVAPLTQLAPAVYSVAAVFIWGTSDFTGGYAAKRANAFVLTAFSHFCACVLMFGVSLAQHDPIPNRASIVWALLAGAMGGISLAIFYRALSAGQMGLTAPIAALLGAAIPTLVDIALEGAPSRWSIAGFALAIVAIWLITRPEGAGKIDESGRPKSVAAAALAGVGFAGFYLCIHQATGSPAWISAIGRVASLAATVVAIIVTRAPLKLDLPRAAMGMVAGVRKRPFHLRGSTRTARRSRRHYVSLPGRDCVACPSGPERALQPLEICGIVGGAGGSAVDLSGVDILNSRI